MAHLNYKHLRYFWVVARVGNLTRAAKQLNVSQSALSIQIRKLEEQLDHPLFERQGRTLQLTEAGRIALDHAESIFSSGEELLATLKGTLDPRPTLRIGAMSTLSRNFQIALLQPLLDADQTHVILRSGTVESLMRDLESMNLDLVLMNTPAGKDASPDIRSHQLFEQQVSLVATPERLKGQTSIETILEDHPLILPTQESSIRTGIDALVQRLGIHPTVVAEADDMAMLRLLTRRGLGVAPLPPVVVRDEIASGELVMTGELAGVVETFYAITAKRRFPNPALKPILSGGALAVSGS